MDLGLVYSVNEKNGDVVVDMTLTSPGCPLAPWFAKTVENKIKKIKGVKTVKINFVFEPLWTPDKMSDKAREQIGF